MKRLDVTMVAPELDVIGGVVTVIKELMAASPEGIDLRLQPCVGNGDKKQKLRSMLHFQRLWIRRLLTGSRPDVIHLHLGGPVSLVREALYAAEGRALGIPYVAHVHAGHYSEELLAGVHRGRELFVPLLRHAGAVVSVTAHFEESLRQHVPDIRRFAHIPNPMGVADIPGPVFPDPAVAAPEVVYMGWMIEAKGIFDLLDVLPAVHEAVPGTRFVFAGAGDHFERWKAEVDKRDLHDAVDILGWVSGEDKWAALSRADVFCLPSHSEGMPMTVLEAMGMGKPVVATGISGMLEQVVPGETGLLFPLHDKQALTDALIEVCRDGSRRRAMGEAGRARLEQHYERGVIAERWRALWTDVAQSG